MADHVEEERETFIEKIADKIHDHDSSSSSSDSDDDTKNPTAHSSAFQTKVFRLFGREKPVHKVLGGGKSADVLLWRNKKVSATVVGFATAVYVLFELLQYHLLTLTCHLLILVLAVLFLWSNISSFINRPPPEIPDFHISEDIIRGVVSTLRAEINCALNVIRDILSGRELKKFLAVVAGLWVISVIGAWSNFLTLSYIVFVLLHTVPFFYEKHEDRVDPLAEKAFIELKKQYAVFDAKVLSKIPKGPLKDKKHA
ncbi:reticulon-like protein B1 [Impatiens glandulifera]|uniref:reticulon-like protein B1 n=1 Tax=Impatiens glandulifera TaxID=253017 RepID=UPI001FB137BA|nr:reticulon-like protein B1 [Impatiens glandulifera]